MEKTTGTENLNTGSAAGALNQDGAVVKRHKAAFETNWLAVLAHKLGRIPSAETTTKDFSISGEPLNEDELDFLDVLSDKSELIVEAIDLVEAATTARTKLIAAQEAYIAQRDAARQQENEPKPEEGEPKPELEEIELEEIPPEPVPYVSDMGINVHISRDFLMAYCCIFPPIGEGKTLSAQQLYSLVQQNGVECGIDESIIQSALDSDSLMKIFVIARGKDKTDGVDGYVIDRFSREQKISISENEGQLVDYRNLNWLQIIHAGDVICDIVKAIASEDGIDVRGVEIKGVSGKKPKIPNGVNTAVSEDGLALVATSDGQLSFKGGSFRIDQVVNIDSDVDNSIGNLDVIGAVNIKGNVNDGFKIVATGDIVVRGLVEGAYLKSGGNIQIFHGMNGGSKGKLEAHGTVTSKYLENCSVIAGGTVKSDSIVNSTVVSSDIVTAVTGKGVIIASNVTGFKGIEAKTIGNERNLLSNLTVGADPILLEELQVLLAQVAEMKKRIEESDKNINYLEAQRELEPQYQQLLSKIKFDCTVDKMKLAKKEQRMVVISELLTDVSSQITASEIFPPVNVTIGKLKLSLTNTWRMCRIYKSEGEILVGKK